MGILRNIVPADIGEFLRYEEGSGRLVWIKDLPTARKKHVGDAAGSSSPLGYVFVQFRGTKHPAAHIICFLKTGQQAAVEMDHVDGDPSNNRWSNLRPADHAENAYNRRGWGRFKKGAYFNKRTERFQSSITVDQKAIFLGVFDTEDEAHAAYAAAALKFHGEFARTE